MRDVLVQKFHVSGGKYVKHGEPLPAKFHQWGSQYEEFETGPGNYSVAIIEFPNGEIDTFMPNQITFAS